MARRFVTSVNQDRIAIVKIDNPPTNALTDETAQDLEAVFDELTINVDKVSVVILTGSGDRCFVSGADIKMFPTLNPQKAKVRLKKSKQRFLKIETFEKPIICAINGFCLGAGLELAMCCDIRIAADHAMMGQPEINVGLIPGAGGTQRLSRLVGEGVAKELIYTGRFIDAEEGKSIGLINKVVPKESLIDEAKKMAQLLASKPPLALRAAKESIHRGACMTLEQGLDLEIEQWSYLCGTEDQKEGARAFIEKRPPVFLGK